MLSLHLTKSASPLFDWQEIIIVMKLVLLELFQSCKIYPHHLMSRP